MNVADVMTPRDSLVTAEVPGTRDDVLEQLRDGAFSSVPVISTAEDAEEFRGLVSRERLIDEPDEDQLALLVEEVPATSADATLGEVAGLMLREGARRVPVVDGHLEGIVTVTDLVRALANGEVDGGATVAELRTDAVNTVYADTPLPVGERQLSYAQLPYAVVLDDEAEPAGMLTEVDVIGVAEVVEGEASTGDSIADEDDDWKWEGIKAVGSRYTPTRNVELPDDPVAEFMTEDLVTVSGRKTAREAAQLMIRHDIEQIPVTDGGEMVGILRDTDLLEALE